MSEKQKIPNQWQQAYNLKRDTEILMTQPFGWYEPKAGNPPTKPEVINVTLLPNGNLRLQWGKKSWWRRLLRFIDYRGDV